MKIFIINWRDIKNPLSGGAEIFTHEIAKRWVKRGHDVTWFTSAFDKASETEVIDGIRIIRQGFPDLRHLQNSVHFKVYSFYKKNIHDKYDVIIDEIHGIPFLAPLYMKEPVVPLICEVADTIWDRMFPFPWNKIGKLAERLSLSLYKNKKFLTISPSTKDDLVRYGIPKKSITVLPMGINREKIKLNEKEKQLTIIFVARINKMKGIEDAIKAMTFVTKEYPLAKLWIIGRGDEDYIYRLKKDINNLLLTENIIFWNFITQKKKFKLMSKAHILISPSSKEGFGLTIPEAGSVGTPAIVYNVPGLRDIVDDRNGIVLKKNTPEELGKQIITLFQNKKMYNTKRKWALETSKFYDWEKTTEAALQILNNS